MTMRAELFHYTCAHSVGGIELDRMLSPNPQPQLGGVELTWMTDLTRHDLRVAPNAVGLEAITSTGCNRMRHSYTVHTEGMGEVIMWWPKYRRTMLRAMRSQMGDRAAHVLALQLETLEHGRMPTHWWVAETEVPILERLD